MVKLYKRKYLGELNNDLYGDNRFRYCTCLTGGIFHEPSK